MSTGAARTILPHLGQIAVPGARPGQLQDAAGLHPVDEVLERAIDRARIRSLAAEADGLVEQLLT